MSTTTTIDPWAVLQDKLVRRSVPPIITEPPWPALEEIFDDVKGRMPGSISFFPLDDPRRYLRQRLLNRIGPHRKPPREPVVDDDGFSVIPRLLPDGRPFDLEWLERERDFENHTWTEFEMDCVRWAVICEVMDRHGESWDDAPAIASHELAEHPAKGSEATMRRGFAAVQEVLKPLGLNHPRRPRGPNRPR